MPIGATINNPSGEMSKMVSGRFSFGNGSFWWVAGGRGRVIKFGVRGVVIACDWNGSVDKMG